MNRQELERELERLHPESFGWALACCERERARAEDVLQETYLRIISGTARFGGRSTLRTWLFGIIRRVALEDARRRPAFPHGPVMELVDETPRSDERIETDEAHEELRAALGELSARQREVLMLVFYHDLTIEEAARVMDVSLGTARTHYERGKKALLAQLTEGTRR